MEVLGGTLRYSLSVPVTPPDERVVDSAVPAYLFMESDVDVKIVARIIHGGGTVFYRGLLLAKGAIERNGQPTCAIKEVPPGATLSRQANLDQFHHEVLIMWTLSFHPNIIHLLGYCETPSLIITQYYKSDVYRFLHSQKDATPLEDYFLLHLCTGMAAALAGVWLFFHIAVSCVSMPLTNCAAAYAEKTVQHDLESVPSDPGMRGDTLVIVNAMLDLWGANVPIALSSMGKPVPRHCRELCAGVNDLDVGRLDERTLVLRPDNSLLDSAWTTAFRNPRQDPFHAGDRVALEGMGVEVTAVTPDGRPAEMVFRFDRPLEDSSLRWIAYQNGRYASFKPPAPGQTVHIANQGLAEAARACISSATAVPSK